MRAARSSRDGRLTREAARGRRLLPERGAEPAHGQDAVTPSLTGARSERVRTFVTEGQAAGGSDGDEHLRHGARSSTSRSSSRAGTTTATRRSSATSAP